MAKNLAGLAALGALGVILRDKMGDKQKNSGAFYEAGSGPTAETTPVDDNGAFYEAGSGPTGAALARNPGPMDDESQWGTAVPGQVAYKKKRPMTSGQTLSSQGSRYPTPAQRLTTSNDPRVNPDFDPTSAQGAGPSSYPTQGTRPSTGNIGPTMRSPRGDIIPGQSVRAPQGGERVDSTELGRNAFNGLNAMGAAGKLAGVGKMATEAATMGRVQRAYNAQQAARRAAEGLSPAEAAAARQRLAEAAFEGGMKKGGSVKAKGKSKSVKMSSGGSARSSASKRGDGIASKGRTRGKMY
jgi:hypothetical protein